MRGALVKTQIFSKFQKELGQFIHGCPALKRPISRNH
jgi:hypothetical protein